MLGEIKKIMEKLESFFKEKGILKASLYIVLFLFFVLIVISILIFLFDYIKSYGSYSRITPAMYHYKYSTGYQYIDYTEEGLYEEKPRIIKTAMGLTFKDKDFKTVENDVLNIIKGKCDYYKVISRESDKTPYSNFYYLTVEIKKDCYSNIIYDLIKLKPSQYYLRSNLDKEYYEKEIKKSMEELKIKEEELNNLIKNKNELIKSLNNTEYCFDKTKIIEKIKEIESDIHNVKMEINKIKWRIELLNNTKNMAYVRVRVENDKILNWKEEKRIIKESWLRSIKELIDTINDALRKLTIDLVNLIIKAFVFFVNIFVIIVMGLVALKVVWKVGKKILKF